MLVEKAKLHYLGKDGHVKMNCGEAVIHAFKDKFEVEDKIIDDFANYGGGRAPEGVCGAYYAAKILLKEFTDLNELDTLFKTKAGSNKCKDIRSLGKLSCLGCVEKAAETLNHVKQEK